MLIISGLFSCKISDGLQSDTILIQVERQNILYSGIDNYVKIGLPQRGGVMFEVDNGEIVHVKENSRWVIIPEKVGTCQLFLSGASDTLERIYFFRVLQVPPPILQLRAALSHENNSTGEINLLIAMPPNDFPYEARYEIKSFKVSLLDSEGMVLYEDVNDGSRFNSKLLLNLSSFYSDVNRLSICEIEFLYPDGTIGRGNSITLNF